jgi:hypothetical protein
MAPKVQWLVTKLLYLQEEDRLVGRKKIQKKISDEQIRQELQEFEVKITRIRNSSAFKSKQVGKWKQLNFDGEINGELKGTTRMLIRMLNRREMLLKPKARHV